jgi:hypothetical protein
MMRPQPMPLPAAKKGALTGRSVFIVAGHQPSDEQLREGAGFALTLRVIARLDRAIQQPQ